MFSSRSSGIYFLGLFALLLILASAPHSLAQDDTTSPAVAVSGNDEPPPAATSDTGPSGMAEIPPEHRRDAVLMTLGAVSGQSLMLTYTSIATLADAYVEEVYTPEQAAGLTQDYLSMTDSVRQSLTFLLQSGILAEQDAELLARMLEAYGYLHRQIEAFGFFVETGDPQWVEVYEESRDLAWEAIEGLSS